MSLRTGNLPATLSPRSLCKSPPASHLRHCTVLNDALVCSAGFAGGYIDKQVETKGVSNGDLVAIALLIHTLAARLSRQKEGTRRRSVLVFNLVALTIYTNQIYSHDKVG